MYPYLFGAKWLDLYWIFIFIGLIAGLLLFRFNCDKSKISDKPYNFYALNAIISIFSGFIFAFLFNNLYNSIESAVTGKAFVWRGVTFMGGLIGGVLTFVLITVFFGKDEVKAEFWTIVNLAVPTILLAHAFGRIGCFCAGCCGGIETDGAFGVLFPGHTHATYPTQLFEAIFLFMMFGVSMALIYKFEKTDKSMLLYCFSYSIFRFMIEFLRGDDRGMFVPGLSPSQFQSILLFLAGLIIMFVVDYKKIIPFNKAKARWEKEKADLKAAPKAEAENLNLSEK